MDFKTYRILCQLHLVNCQLDRGTPLNLGEYLI